MRAQATIKADAAPVDAASAPRSERLGASRVPRSGTIPPENLYWSIVECPAWVKPGIPPPGVLSEFLLDCPVEADQLHAIACALDEHHVLVYAIEREELSRLAAGSEAGASLTSLAPASLPAFVGAPVNTQHLNLLVGMFEPGPVRRARTLRHAVRASGILAVALLLSIGLVRRERASTIESKAARAATAALLESVSPGLRPRDLTSTLNGYREAAKAATALKPPTDAALAFARLLAAWPTSQPIKPQTIGVSEQGVSIALVVEGDPASFIKAFKAPEGYTLDEPRLNAVAGTGGGGLPLTRMNLQLKPTGVGAKGVAP